jgi:hypothetical protein
MESVILAFMTWLWPGQYWVTARLWGSRQKGTFRQHPVWGYKWCRYVQSPPFYSSIPSLNTHLLFLVLIFLDAQIVGRMMALVKALHFMSLWFYLCSLRILPVSMQIMAVLLIHLLLHGGPPLIRRPIKIHGSLIIFCIVRWPTS